MSERDHQTSQSRVVSANGLNPSHGYCVPTAWARALASDPGNDEEVSRLFPHVLRRLQHATRGRMRKGAWYGGQEAAANAVGFTGYEVRKAERDPSKTDRVTVRDYWGMTYEQYRTRQAFPTLAQWVRQNPDVKRAVVRGTGHAGYVERAADGTLRVFDMGARKRIDHAIILDHAEPPANLVRLADAPRKKEVESARPVKTFRFARVRAKNGSWRRIKVNARGEVPESDQQRIGCVHRVSVWTEVKAPTQAEAGRIFENGGGRKICRDAKLTLRWERY